jgi:hypothetical protein
VEGDFEGFQSVQPKSRKVSTKVRSGKRRLGTPVSFFIGFTVCVLLFGYSDLLFGYTFGYIGLTNFPANYYAFRIQILAFRIQILAFRIQTLAFRIQRLFFKYAVFC